MPTVPPQQPQAWQEPSAEEMLRFAQFAVDHAAEAVFWVRPDGQFFYVNNEACRTLGYSREELLRLRVRDVTNYDDSLWQELAAELEASGSLRMETEHVRKDGSILPVEVTINFLEFRRERCRVAFVRDISQRKKADETIHRMAYRDSLTGLPNRALFDDRLFTALARAERYNRKLSIMLLDLSDFKQVNDTLGHEFGDKVLKAISERLSSIVRSCDTIARWGGDEFVLLVELKGDDDAATIASKLLTSLENPFCVDGKTLEVGASLGVAVYP